jgi:cell division protein FtsQ
MKPLSRIKWILHAVASVIAMAAFAAAGWYGYRALMSQPFERVVFSGNADKLARADLDALAQTVKGMTSIATVREAAKRVPWVREASVRREYPDTVEIAFETHDVLARWGERALVSSRGDVFNATFAGSLPRFRGPDNGAAMIDSAATMNSARAMAAEYPAIARGLAPLAAAVTELRLSPRGGWHVVLDSGLELELGRGRGEIHPRIARFVAAWTKLAAQGVEARFADLRHANGFAVRTENANK